MQHNALIIDQQLAAKFSFSSGQPEKKRLVCRLDEPDCLTRLYGAAYQLNERPCLCLVVTDRTETAGLAQIGGFETVTSAEYAAMND